MTLLDTVKGTSSSVRSSVDFLLGKLVLYDPIVPKADLHGKRALVTGANVGIGLEIARSLADQGANTYLLCRNKEKAGRAQEELKNTTGNHNIFVEVVDFGNPDSVRAFVDRWGEQEDRKIDILVNNAGANNAKASHIKQDLERTYAVNFLISNFLLTILLLNKGYFCPNARIVLVASKNMYDASAFTTADFNSDDVLEPYHDGDDISIPTMKVLYDRSKAMQVMFTAELQERLEKSNQWRDVVVQCCHPGCVNSSIWYRDDGVAHFPTLVKITNIGMPAFGISVQQGALTPVYLATSPDAAQPEVRGKYWDRCRWKWIPSWMLDQKLKAEFWKRWEEDAGEELKL